LTWNPSLGITGVGELEGDVELNVLTDGEMITLVGINVWVVINVVPLAVVVTVAVVTISNDTNTVAVAVEFAGPLAMPLPLETVSIFPSKCLVT
jgi:hypothetical protein